MPAASLDDIIAALLDVLGDGVARTEQQLADDVRAHGLDVGPGPQAAETVGYILDEVEPAIALPVDRGRWVHVPSLMRERALTHRLSADEVARDYLGGPHDLAALEVLIDDGSHQRLVDGTLVDFAVVGFDDDLLAERWIEPGAAAAVVLLQPGVLRRLGAAAGDLLGVHVHDDAIELTIVDAPGPADELASALTAGVLHADPPGPVPLDSLVWQACVDHPDLLRRPTAPIGEVLAAAGLAESAGMVALAGFDFDEWCAGQRIERIAEMLGLDEDAAFAVDTLAQSFRELGDVIDVAAIATASAMGEDTREHSAEEPTDEDDARAMIALLADPVAAQAFVDETIGSGSEGAATLAHLTTILERGVPRAARANLRWVRAVATERQGSILDAEMLLGEALDLDEHCWLALRDLAQIASDRGDAERGLSLLRRAEAHPDDDLVRLLETLRPVERTDVGRNDPCPCGSGRKFKVCHRGRVERPLEERAAWLYRKAAMYVVHGAHRPRTVEVAEILAGWDADDDAVWDALEGPLAADLMLVEGGVFEEFLAVRGVLLPDDERALAETWRDVRRSVHEVVDAVPGRSLTLRDLASPEAAAIVVEDRVVSGRLGVGALICARLLPVAGEVRGFGGFVEVDPDRAPDLLALLASDPAPEDVAALLV